MDEELMVAEQIVRLLHDRQNKIWELVENPAPGRSDTPGVLNHQPVSPHGPVVWPPARRDHVAICDARGQVVAVARALAA